MDISGSQLHPMVQVLFPNNDAVFQDNLLIHTTRSVQSSFEEHEDVHVLRLLWLAHSPNLNIMEPLWSVLESRVRSRFLPSSLKQLEEEWYSIPLGSIQNLNESIPRRIQAVLQANGGPTPYYKEICIWHSCFHYFCPSPVHAARLNSLGWLDKLVRNVFLSVGVLFNSLPCLYSVILLDGFVLLTCFHHNHFLLHSTPVLMSHLWLSYLVGKILLLSCQRSRHVAVHH